MRIGSKACLDNSAPGIHRHNQQRHSSVTFDLVVEDTNNNNTRRCQLLLEEESRM